MRLAREWELGQTATVLRYDSDRMVLRFDHLPAYNSSTWDNPEKWFELEESLDPKLPDWF